MIVWMLAAALGAECEGVSFKDVVSLPAPAVIVLGEQFGSSRDLKVAEKVVKTLAKDEGVVLALEALHRDAQPAIDAYADGKVGKKELPVRLLWDDHWVFPFDDYEGLVTAERLRARVVGAGIDMGPKPEDAEVVLPPRYLDLLRAAMGGHAMPLGTEGDLVQAMVWREHAIATRAVERWKGVGFLVVVVSRSMVEGGKGVAWQIDRLTEHPVHAFMLNEGVDPPCHPGDRYIR